MRDSEEEKEGCPCELVHYRRDKGWMKRETKVLNGEKSEQKREDMQMYRHIVMYRHTSGRRCGK